MSFMLWNWVVTHSDLTQKKDTSQSALLGDHHKLSMAYGHQPSFSCLTDLTPANLPLAEVGGQEGRSAQHEAKVEVDVGSYHRLVKNQTQYFNLPGLSSQSFRGRDPQISKQSVGN